MKNTPFKILCDNYDLTIDKENILFHLQTETNISITFKNDKFFKNRRFMWTWDIAKDRISNLWLLMAYLNGEVIKMPLGKGIIIEKSFDEFYPF